MSDRKNKHGIQRLDRMPNWFDTASDVKEPANSAEILPSPELVQIAERTRKRSKKPKKRVVRDELGLFRMMW
jgi:hypothetical protein